MRTLFLLILLPLMVALPTTAQTDSSEDEKIMMLLELGNIYFARKQSRGCHRGL